MLLYVTHVKFQREIYNFPSIHPSIYPSIKKYTHIPLCVRSFENFQKRKSEILPEIITIRLQIILANTGLKTPVGLKRYDEQPHLVEDVIAGELD